MPARGGIHDLLLSLQRKSWIPGFAGMTRSAQRRWVNCLVGWYQACTGGGLTFVHPIPLIDSVIYIDSYGGFK
jgi:hypothetical protein